MALVMIAFLPIMMITAFVSSYYMKRSEKFSQNIRTRMDSDVIEVFDSIRTVRMLAGENYETERYIKDVKKLE